MTVPDDGPGRPPSTRPPEREPDEPRVTGTIFIMLLFLMALGGMWLIMYFQLLSR